MSTVNAAFLVAIVLTTLGAIVVGVLTESATGWLITAIGITLFVLEMGGWLSWALKKYRLAQTTASNAAVNLSPLAEQIP